MKEPPLCVVGLQTETAKERRNRLSRERYAAKKRQEAAEAKAHKAHNKKLKDAKKVRKEASVKLQTALSVRGCWLSRLVLVRNVLLLSVSSA